MTSPLPEAHNSPDCLLKWYRDIGADDVLAETPRSWFEDEDKSLKSSVVQMPAPDSEETLLARGQLRDNEEVISGAEDIAKACTTLSELRAALERFDHCPLKKTAQNLVFFDGHENANLLLLGEAPGADEDRIGKPFVGRSGQLLDKMLHAIGLSRNSEKTETSVLISNMVFWRPPGNRKPTDLEIHLCQPFVRRLIELVDPHIIVCLGATPMHRLIGGTQGILRARGTWQSYTTKEKTIPVLPTLHPAYLLRAPAQKKFSWLDFKSIQHKLNNPGT